MSTGAGNVTESLEIVIVEDTSLVMKLELVARIVKLDDPVGATGVPVKYARSVPLNANDKSDRRLGEKILEIPTLLEK